MKFSKFDTLNTAISTLEDMGNFEEADKLHHYFIKEAAKKKSKKKKNVPNNPSLWAECKAWAKRTFDVYPSAYANGAAAKRYKSKGGTWRKASAKNKVKTSQINSGGETYYEYGNAAKNLMSSINIVANNPSNKLDDYVNYYEQNKDSFNPSEQIAIEKTIANAKSMRERQGTFTTDVYQPYDVLGNKTEPIKPETEPFKPEPFDKWSGYMEMPYIQVIETAKKWLLKGDKDDAKSMINAVSIGSKELNAAQKSALKKHFERILFTFQEMGRQPSGVFENAYSDANNLLFSLKRKYNLQDQDLKIGSINYGLIMNEINKYTSPVRNPDLTRRTKQIALQLLRTLSMDNRSKNFKQGK